MSAEPFWYCNKCRRVGKAPTREEANKAHDELLPVCNYYPAGEDPGACPCRVEGVSNPDCRSCNPEFKP